MNENNKLDFLGQLSPEMIDVLRYQREHAASSGEMSLPEARLHYQQERRFWNEGGPQMERITDVDVPYEEGVVRTRLFCPQQRISNGCLFYLHGGGFVVGNLDTHDRIMRLLAQESGCVVIGVDYTLAPEARFPRAIKEIAAVSRFFRQHSTQYQLDLTCCGYAGDSAGALLALSACLWMRDHGEDISGIRALLLYYGLYGLQDSRTRRWYGGEWDGLTQVDLRYYQQMYLARESDMHSPHYCIFNNDLAHAMPACFIAACEFDPLRDDSETLATVLQEKNIHCEYRVYPGTLHAFLHYSRMMKAAGQAIADGAAFFRTFV
ncbi:acetyl esterase [Enterobacillus tribolii]|uniref:Acetyl esterase n=1 Tax=Enterobacillus tribolii TaxID=1487935 RepID=A0A370R2D3_9GAMM|nr:acetyl esterase [Enterobacillus tribolii]MBW7983648.1 acetyl esterase [Enterobacillus tribolii]RDK96576.1 acetyl esterase [Enterobacillus tribolii]